MLATSATDWDRDKMRFYPHVSEMYNFCIPKTTCQVLWSDQVSNSKTAGFYEGDRARRAVLYVKRMLSSLKGGGDGSFEGGLWRSALSVWAGWGAWRCRCCECCRDVKVGDGVFE